MKAEQFREIRLKLGLTQAQLAKALGYKNTKGHTITRYENGTRNIPPPVSLIMRALAYDQYLRTMLLITIPEQMPDKP